MDRRELMRMGTGAVLTGFAASVSAAPASFGDQKPMDDKLTNENVEQWGVFEFGAHGPSAGNPFVDVQFGARFTLGHRSVEAAGFYDGDGLYKVRFSPDTVGRWSFETASNVKELAGLTGGFECVAPAAGN